MDDNEIQTRKLHRILAAAEEVLKEVQGQAAHERLDYARRELQQAFDHGKEVWNDLKEVVKAADEEAKKVTEASKAEQNS